MTDKKTVLITGCSDGGLGAGLAEAFHKKGGFQVIATARDPGKMSALKGMGIETLPLDVLSDKSIETCLGQVTKMTGGSLDMLVNNAGGGYSMPVSDIKIEDAKKLFDLNFWSIISLTQAMLPLLIKAKGVVVNNTSVSSLINTPYFSMYGASKAAASSLTDHMRVEFAPFGVKAVDLKTGAVKSNFFQSSDTWRLPAGSIYQPIEEKATGCMRGEGLQDKEEQNVWAEAVVRDLTKGSVPAQIWRGKGAGMLKLALTLGPKTSLDGTMSKMGGLDVLTKKLKK